MSEPPVILNLFAGPGGWCEGLRSIQPDAVSVGIEHDAAACKTRDAAGHLTIRADVTTYPPEAFAGKVDGLIASPPCPDFSSAGKKRGINGDTGRLIFEVPRWVGIVRPTWVACEQVPEALSWWEMFARQWEQSGAYKTWTGILCAADYGVPQERYRAFLLAHSEHRPQPPVPSHAEHPHPDLFTGSEPSRWVSMAEGLGWGANRRPCPVTAEKERAIVGYRRWRGTGITERHGARPDTPSECPAPTLTSKSRTDMILRAAGTANMKERERRG